MELLLSHKVEVLGFLLALSELLALTPLKSNSIFELVVSLVKKLAGK
jgi:hypothetical protein